MKYIVVLGDGMADRPVSEIGNKTPLEEAVTKTIDRLSEKAEIGLSATIPEGMKPGSDTANLSVLGYDPKIYYTGRSPLEALSIGAPMKDTDIALRTNIVTIKEGCEAGSFGEFEIIDHSSSEIDTESSGELLKACVDAFEADEAFKKEYGIKDGEFKFYVGTSYRHCLIWDKGEVVELSQPHDHLTEKIGQYMPVEFNENNSLSDVQKDGLSKLQAMMKKSYEVLNHHPINEERRKKGLNPANCMWFWGAGTKPMLSDFKELNGKKGAMISAVDLLKGIAVGANLHNIIVEGANGQLETNYEGKADAALKALLEDGFDFVYIHVEAPDEMGHQGSLERKIKAIEYLDARLIARVVDGLEKSGEDFRILIMPDHATPLCVRTHTSEPIPYLLYDSRKDMSEGASPCGAKLYSEKNAAALEKPAIPGPLMIKRLFEE